MGLETATYIKDLNPLWPLGGSDNFDTLLNHLQLIKHVLKNTFPNITGQVTAANIDLGMLKGQSSTPTQVTPYVSGTKKLFYQAAAPVGWTQDVTHNDSVFMVVSGAGAGTGGSWVFTGATLSSDYLYTSQMPSHTHDTLWNGILIPGADVEGIIPGVAKSNSDRGGGSNLTSRASLTTQYNDSVITVVANRSNDPHTHPGATGDGTWRPAYIDCIVCSKDAT